MFVCHIPIIPGILQNFLLLYIFIIFDIKDFVVCVAINNIKMKALKCKPSAQFD